YSPTPLPPPACCHRHLSASTPVLPTPTSFSTAMVPTCPTRLSTPASLGAAAAAAEDGWPAELHQQWFMRGSRRSNCGRVSCPWLSS
ncbi:unnamed protein product, partial [Candidula unifasciata]